MNVGPLDEAPGDTELEYNLRVIQQPIRARSCGQGDKDRRPISPPIIVKLEGIRGGQKLGPTEFDTSKFILAVDLRDAATFEDMNLVANPFASMQPPNRNRCSPSDPRQIASYSPPLSSEEPQPRPPTHLATKSPPLPSGLVTFEEDRKPSIPPISPEKSHSSSNDEHTSKKRRLSPPQWETKPTTANFSASSSTSESISPALTLTSYPDGNSTVLPNLIGTLHTNSHVLTDPDGASKGIYFVLPDLSVRMEGNFRLRLRLLSLDLSKSLAGLTTPLVTSTLTDEFQVFNPKKFPGMLDPTPLSKHFAAQGVRIPTRQTKKRSISPPQASTSDKS